MMREETVFGPIHSRRLGRSLGINLLPVHGKICNFDCIYCECGWNREGREDTVLPTASKVRSDLEDKLTELMLEGTRIDSITFGSVSSTAAVRRSSFRSPKVELISIPSSNASTVSKGFSNSAATVSGKHSTIQATIR